jgi:hypothetical protein
VWSLGWHLKHPVCYPIKVWDFISSKNSRPALGSTQPPTKCVSRLLSRGLQRPGRQTHHWPVSGVEIKIQWSYNSVPRSCVHDVEKEEFTFTVHINERMYQKCNVEITRFSIYYEIFRTHLPCKLCICCTWARNSPMASKQHTQLCTFNVYFM